MLDIGEEANRLMKKTIKYTDEPMKLGKVVDDFLPPPSKLVLREDTVKVTLALSKESIDFFKNEAKKNNVPYQKMIRSLVDRYVENHV